MGIYRAGKDDSVRTEMKSLLHIIRERTNDYRSLEQTYSSISGEELVCDPLNSLRSAFCLTVSTSIVIPAWNASQTIEKCLLAIEHSSFNQKYSHLLQVVVVDDGSVDGTWDLLLSIKPNLNLTVIRQPHHSRSHAMNAGIKISKGDVIISCDSDIIMSYHTIEEFIKRHQVIGDALLIGFRSDVDADDPLIHRDAIHDTIRSVEPALFRDNRLEFDWPGWPENMCVETEHLRTFGNGRRLWMPSGEAWGLPRIVYGALFSMPRSNFVLMDGYDEDFRGWGWEDTMVGARAVGLNNYLIPVYSATGLHISHPHRSQRKWLEAAQNRRLYQTKIRMATQVSGPESLLDRSPNRVIETFDQKAGSPKLPFSSNHLSRFDDLPSFKARYLYLLGRYREAADAYAGCVDELGRSASLYHQGRALRAAQRYKEAVFVLTESAALGPAHTFAFIELGVAFAAMGQFAAGRRSMEQFYQQAPRDRSIRFILKSPCYKHLRRGMRHASQGFHRLALRDFEVILLREPDHKDARLARLASLEHISA